MAKGIFAGGNGGATAPYLIEDADDLNAIRRNLDAHYKLINNINMDVSPYKIGAGWKPISKFTGTLNGNGKKIINLYISRADEDNVGLFDTRSFAANYAGGPVVYDLALENVDISGKTNVGGLFGSMNLALTSSAPPSDIIVRVSTSGCIQGLNNVGGLLGQATLPGISGTYVGWRHDWMLANHIICKCQISSVAQSQDRYIGGIIGNSVPTNSYHQDASAGYVRSYIGIRNAISLCSFKTNDLSLIGKSHMSGSVDLPASVLVSCFCDTSLLNGNTANNGVTKMTTNEWFALGAHKELKEYRFNEKTLYRFKAGKYPQFWFSNQDCFFVRAGQKYLTYDGGRSIWVEQFDNLPDTATILAKGMASIAHIDTKAWDQLRQYEKVDVINFIESMEKLLPVAKLAEMPKITAQDDGATVCYSKDIVFAHYNSDILSVVPE